MIFLILLAGVGVLALGYYIGRHAERYESAKEIRIELNRAMEEERQRLVEKATENLKK